MLRHCKLTTTITSIAVIGVLAACTAPQASDSAKVGTFSLEKLGAHTDRAYEGTLSVNDKGCVLFTEDGTDEVVPLVVPDSATVGKDSIRWEDGNSDVSVPGNILTGGLRMSVDEARNQVGASFPDGCMPDADQVWLATSAD